MKASELRLGNWISTSGKEHKASLWDIDKLLERNDHWRDKVVKPIPLTEEWLEKFDVLFGFQKFVFEYLFESYSVRLPIGVGSSAFIGRVEYVHELQNLYFALTNTELETKD